LGFDRSSLPDPSGHISTQGIIVFVDKYMALKKASVGFMPKPFWILLPAYFEPTDPWFSRQVHGFWNMYLRYGHAHSLRSKDAPNGVEVSTFGMLELAYCWFVIVVGFMVVGCRLHDVIDPIDQIN